MSCYKKYLNETLCKVEERVHEEQIKHIENFMKEHLHEQAFSNKEGRPDFQRLVTGYCYQELIEYPDRTNPLVEAVEIVAGMMLDSDNIRNNFSPEALVEFVLWIPYPDSSYIESCQFRFDKETTSIIASITTVLDTREYVAACGQEEIDKWFRRFGFHLLYHAVSVSELNWSFEPCRLIGEWKTKKGEETNEDYLYLKFIFPDTSYWEYFME